MLQNSLFKNMPKLEEDIRERNKAIREKTKRPSSSAGKTSVRSANKIAQAIEVIRKTAAERLEREKGKYLNVMEEAQLIAYVDAIIAKGIAGLDTETDGLDPINDALVGTCLYVPGMQGIYVPHKHTDISRNVLPGQISYEIMAREMKRMVDAGVKFVLHNAKFDLRFIWNWLGVWFIPHWDTSIAGNFLNENEPHGLKVLYEKYVTGEEDKDLNTFQTLFGTLPFSYVPLDIAYLYAGKDPVMTYELYEFQLPFLTPGNPACVSQKLEDAARLYLETEVPLIPYLAEMENEGVYINTEISNRLSKTWTEKMKEAAIAANEILKTFNYKMLPPAKREKLSGPIDIGETQMEAIINIGSPTQLAIVLYDLLELTSPNREKPRGTGEDLLQIVKGKTDDEQVKELIDHILDFRGAKKLLSTYIDKLPAVVKEKTGRLHGSFNQYGAKTGRMSSSDPNLRNEGLMLATA